MSDTKIYPTTYLDLPCSDGQPMGETEAHGLEMSEFLRDILRDLYADEPMVYVASNNFVYYDPSDVRKSACPDCYVVKGIEKRLRDSYQAWAEDGILPCVVFELTSHSTWRADTVFKRRLYQSWACQEYFLYDLRADKIPGHLLGYRLQDGVYQEIQFNSRGRLVSEELELELGHSQGHLRFFRPGSEQPIPTRSEKVEEQRIRAEQAEQELERERNARSQQQALLEDEIRRLKVEMDRFRKG